MKRTIFAVAALALGLHAATASAEWAFDDPFWKASLASTATREAQAGMITNYQASMPQAYAFVTDYSPL